MSPKGVLPSHSNHAYMLFGHELKPILIAVTGVLIVGVGGGLITPDGRPSTSRTIS